MTFEHNPQHAERGILKFAAPFWGKPRWAALFVAIARQIQELEDAARDVIISRMLANATGAQLAELGELVGQVDPGYGQEVFRNLIRVRIRINRSGDSRDDLIEIMQLLGIPLAQRTLTNAPPAKFRLDLVGSMPLPIAILHSTLVSVLGAGIGLLTMYSSTPSFVFTNNTTAPGARGAWANAGSGGAPWAFAAGPN